MTLTDAGNAGEESVREVLREIKGTLISGFIRSKNICYYNKNFQIDFLLFTPKIGLVILEVKNWKGTVKAVGGERWVQEVAGYKNEFGNASLQSLRTSGMLLQILEKGRVNKWPIRPLVVFAHDNAKILKANGKHAPQTDIILKSMIPKWITENSSDEIMYKFTSTEFEAVKSVISQYTSEYVENT
ncbi:nuclease-related domain-containing protein [Pseudomonas sediminis]|uniref:NERD domain-containing protein n=1 Tax=Pseudomonas sediminis TaxID=1691904 RepID=A0ABX6SPB0_9PSED|nr:nuclease-related domain-containing protein [Pseudomonas sediminis]QNH02990.1 NERD domain-containing protein [Pseudomonas sediminis]